MTLEEISVVDILKINNRGIVLTISHYLKWITEKE